MNFIIRFYTHVADTPPVFPIMDRKITDGTQSARRRKINLHTRSVHNSHLSAPAQNGHFQVRIVTKYNDFSI